MYYPKYKDMPDAAVRRMFSLKARLILFMAALLSFTILAISTLFFINARNILTKRILTDLTAIADSKAGRITDVVELNFEQVSLVASKILLRRNLMGIMNNAPDIEKRADEISEALKEAAGSVKFIEGLDAISPDGIILASSLEENVGRDASKAKSFIEGRKGRYIADLYLNDNVLVYDISMPIFSLGGPEKKAVGVLKAQMETARLFNMLSDYTGLGETGELNLGMQEGEDIVFLSPLRHSKISAPLKFRIPFKAEQAEAMERALKKGEGILTGLDYRGVKVLASYKYIPIGDWGLVAKIDFAEAFAPIAGLRWQTVAVSLIVLSFSIIATLYFSNLILKSVRKLQDGIKLISQGSLDYKVDIRSNDEIGELALSFNKMTQELKKITASRNELNQEIAKRKKTEQELIDSLKAKSDFTSKVSHELRTPLTAIREGIGIVLDGSAGGINEEQKDFLDLAKRNVDRLSRLINDILDFQKLESGRAAFSMQKNNLNKIVGEARDAMKAVAVKKGLDFNISLDEGVPEVLLDKDRIMQVLLNLINNSIKFTEKGSIEVATKGGSNFVQVSVRDTGCGISKEDRVKLFQHFVQLNKDLKKTLGGSGLGLAISKEIIEAHGGKIWAESGTGKGTLMNFILPVKERRGRT